MIGGLLMLAAGAAVIELWRRGYLGKVIADLTATAKSDPAVAYEQRRKFQLPTAPVTLGGGGTSEVTA